MRKLNKNNSFPKVSVIIPTYNRPQLIRRAINSVLNQTYRNIEIIIIDGSPNDETEKVIQSYLTDSRIRYFHKPDVHTNTVKDRANIAKARNKAIKMSQGKYIAPLDDDDYWIDEQKLEKQVEFLEKHPDYTLCAGGVIGIYKENPKEISKINTLFPEKDEDLRKMMLFLGGLVHSTVVFRKSDWEKVGEYDEIHPLGEEWDLHLKLGETGKLYSFQEYFAGYVVGEHPREHIKKYGRDCLVNGLRLIKKYRKNYPGFYKSFLTHLIYYFYSFLPFIFRKLLRSVTWQIQTYLYKSRGISKKKSYI